MRNKYAGQCYICNNTVEPGQGFFERKSIGTGGWRVRHADCVSLGKYGRVKELEQDIEQEQMQYDIACEHPTQTDQFYRALEEQRIRLSKKKELLKKMKENI